MAETSAIEWTDATFNPWIGCTKISPACDHCYAEALMDIRHHRVTWGGARSRTSASNWQQPRRWQRQAATFLAIHGRRRRVFCASLADVFDNQVPEHWRVELFMLIADTPDLDWQLLTKRPQNIAKMLPAFWDDVKGHVWLGTTVEDQARADMNIPHLLQHDSAVRFLSIEPMLGPIDLTTHLWGRAAPCPGCTQDADCGCGFYPRGAITGERTIDWVIAGGESGAKARPSHPDWVRSLRDQCGAVGVPFLFKQWGGYLPQFPCYADEFGRDEGDMLCAGRSFPAEGVLYRDGYFYDGMWHQPHTGAGAYWVENVGKKAAGRLLDGVEHNGFPGGCQ